MTSSSISFPWTSSPLIINAPMGGIATSKLAIPVSEAGGLGLIGSVGDLKGIKAEMELCQNHFSRLARFKDLSTLPVGMGFLLFKLSPEEVVQNIQSADSKPPAIFWLFAARSDVDSGAAAVEYAEWAQRLKKAFPVSQIWIQTGGGVRIAVETVRIAKPDVLVVQGNDAGGHGPEVGASLIALIPEIVRDLEQEGLMVPVVAAGGIATAESAAAALMLGANAVVLGTRFLAAREIELARPEYQQRIISTRDGAVATVRAKVFDELKGKNTWPAAYDGRALVSKSYRDWRSGATAEEIVERMSEAIKAGEAGDLGYGVESDRAAIWASSAVGLVDRVMPAIQIVEEVRSGMRRLLMGAMSKL